MFRIVCLFVGVSAVLALISRVADAASPEVEKATEFNYYLASGNLLEAIAKNMSARGPNGRWAQTKWTIDWTKDCDVSVKSIVTLPKVMGTGALSEIDKLKLKNMLVALKAHEMRHVLIGVYAAEEIRRRNCKRTKEISDYWRKKNRELDLRTKHGKSEGVVLR